MLDQFSRNIHRGTAAAFAADQKALGLALELIEKGTDKYAVNHLSIIERFGRFPHRNAALGRKNTSDEETYLAGGALGF